MNRFTKKLQLLLVTISLLLSSPARADEEAVRLIGGVALGILGMALGKSEKEQTEQPAQKTSKRSSTTTKLNISDDIWEQQMVLKKMGFYNGALDGLKGGGTTQAIKKWERSHSLVADGVISEDEYQLLYYDLEDEQDQIDYWKKKQKFLKEKKDSNSDISQQKKTFTDDEISNGAQRFSGVTKDQYLLGACKTFKQKYLTTDVTKKGLKHADTYIIKAKETVSQKYLCNGYAQTETDKIFKHSELLIADSEYAEKIDTLLQILDADTNNYGATNRLKTACSYLTNVTAIQQVELYSSNKIDKETCEHE